MLPKTSRDLEGIDLQILPPNYLVAGLMWLPMVASAERHSKLIANFKTECPRLRKTQVMRIRRLPPADQTRL